jgi:endonuclease YncB( thermonuclease family)
MRGAAVLLSAAIAAPVMLAIALPSNLFGSAPADREWQADRATIRIVDGETLGLGDRIVRLSGIAAPARGEACRTRAGEAFDCGSAATAALTRLVQGRDITCRIVGRDGFGRGLGQCSAGGAEINRALVRGGFAVAESTALRGEEAAARQAAQGLWAHGTGAPATWRTRD